jgi:hypothetical protein
MRIEEFQDLVDTFGERVEDWPSEVREAAVALLESSQHAKDIVAEAIALRAAFNASPVHRAPPELASRITALASAMDAWKPRQERSHPGEPLASFRKDSSRISKQYVWFALFFLAGLGAGLIPAVLAKSLQLDLASLFAVVI